MTDASTPLPTQVAKYIRLEVGRSLSKTEVQQFIQTVDRYGPSNNISSVQVMNPKGEPEDVQVVHRKYKSGKEQYDIPLKRDLTEREVVTILEAWDAFFPTGDFILESSAEDLNAKRKMLADAIVLKQDKYERLCEAIAKTQHAGWMRERNQEGWRYAERYDRKTKTHPMLRPWQELPEKYRKIDPDAPQIFLEEINRQGFMVVQVEEVDKLTEMAYGRGTLPALKINEGQGVPLAFIGGGCESDCESDPDPDPERQPLKEPSRRAKKVDTGRMAKLLKKAKAAVRTLGGESCDDADACDEPDGDKPRRGLREPSRRT